MERITGETLNITDENIKIIAKHFPEAMEEGKIKFDVLKELLGEFIDESNERYQFTWNGKSQALKLSQIPSTGTLLPCKEKSKDWDTTENLYIEGDNLEVLKLLQKSYYKKVKLIYIDPPYNTGSDRIYKDDFEDNIRNYKEYTNQSNRANSENDGRFHTNWLNLMYSRLKLSKNLLKDDGIIFISIDHNEVNNLIKICDEIFGVTNRLGIISLINNLKGRSDSEFFATCNEFLICYAKDYDNAKIGGFQLEDEELDEDYKFEDEISKYKLIGFRKTGNGWRREDRPHMYYPVLFKDDCFNTVELDEYRKIYNSETKTFNDEYVNKLKNKYEKKGYKFYLPMDESGRFGRWRWGLETFFDQKDINLATNSSDNVCTKMRATIEDGSVRLKSAKTLWYKPEYDSGTGAKILKQIFDGKEYFDNPKSLFFIDDILRISTTEDDIVMDFFSGSSTTAHSCMKLNAEYSKKLKFIMVQLPEDIPEDKPAYKDGYKKICEVAEERIRRVGEKIKEETNADIDYGFKVFKLDSSNFKLWNGKFNTEEEANNYFLEHLSPLLDGRTNEDLLYELLLKEGMPLTSPIEEIKIGDKIIYSIGIGDLIVCLEDKIEMDIVNEIGKRKPESIIFRDSGFVDENAKINTLQELKKYGIEGEKIKSI